MDTNALNRLIANAGGKDKVFVCAACGSTKVSIDAYVNANYRTFQGYKINPYTFPHAHCICEQEVRNSYIMTLEEFEKKMREDLEYLEAPHMDLKKFDSLSYLLKRREWCKHFNVKVWKEEYGGR